LARALLRCLAGLILVVLAGLCSSASAQPTSLATVAEGDADEGGRVYLSQSLVALQWAWRYAEAAARVGQRAGFDIERYRAELDTIAQGLERYLQPEGPAPGPLMPVEITGQFLLEGLRGRGPRTTGECQP
jgi:RAQPRD family integrative conjugative element protein